MALGAFPEPIKVNRLPRLILSNFKLMHYPWEAIARANGASGGTRPIAARGGGIGETAATPALRRVLFDSVACGTAPAGIAGLDMACSGPGAGSAGSGGATTGAGLVAAEAGAGLVAAEAGAGLVAAEAGVGAGGAASDAGAVACSGV